MPAHAWLGLAMITVNLLAGVIGAFAWWRVEPSRIFWPLLRIGQLLVVLVAAHGGILYARGDEIPDLHLIYGLMPIGIAFIAEQLRLTSAQAVLDQRDLEDASAVAALSEREQKTIVLTIVRREIGVMAASALVITVLGLRAAEWL